MEYANALYQYFGPISLLLLAGFAATYYMWKQTEKCNKERISELEFAKNERQESLDKVIEVLSENSASHSNLAMAIQELGRRLN